MRFAEATEGEYRIYVGAVEAPGGQGYTAAVVVQRGIGPRLSEVWRDDPLACGYCWPSADEALAYALTRARDMIRMGSPKLAA